MQGSKIRLSNAEMRLFEDAAVILTKNSILQKTALLLTNVQDALVVEAGRFAWTSSPKISKGENYEGLPYVVLDYPRISKEDDLFFIRSMFWWGNFFSSTLQVSGAYAQAARTALAAAYEALSEQHYFVGINKDPWLHHFGEDNYQLIGSLTKEGFAKKLWEAPQLKIAAKWSLCDWDSASDKLIESWKFLAALAT